MATTKTIQPTGETITIPAMTDRPDASVFSTDVSRITDAVNSQNQALATINQDNLVTSNMSLTDFTALCEEKMGDSRGMYFIGYINAGPATSIGLLGSGYIIGLVNTANYKKIVIVELLTSRISTITKVNGTWQTTWSYNNEDLFSNPGDGVYTSVVDSSYNNRLYVRSNGTLAVIGGEFKAASAIGSNAVVIATGCPLSIANSLAQFTAINQSTGQAIQLDVTSTGDLTTFYAGSIAAGNVVRFQCVYPIK